MNVVSFSGGKDSTAMLLMMLEKSIPVDRVIFVDTTKEFPAMYAHIAKVQAMCSVEIEKVEIDFDYWFSECPKRNEKFGKFGYGWPDFRIRWCTHLKKVAVKKTQEMIKSDNYMQYHGIAYDERKRCKNDKNVSYPLVDWEITERQALEYCYSKGLDWGGLYEKFARVSCWCCPLSRIAELRTLYTGFPELWVKLIEMDKKSVRKFRPDYSVAELSEKFYRESQIQTLWQ